MADYEIGDLIRSKGGNIYSFMYNPYLERFMWRRLGKNLDAIWWELSDIRVEDTVGNIFEDPQAKWRK